MVCGYGCGRRGFGEPRQARNGATVAIEPCVRSHLVCFALRALFVRFVRGKLGERCAVCVCFALRALFVRFVRGKLGERCAVYLRPDD